MTKKTSRNAVKKINKQLDQLLKEKKELENTTILKKAEVEKIKKASTISTKKKKTPPKKEAIVVEERKTKTKNKEEVIVPERKAPKQTNKTGSSKRKVSITKENKNKLKNSTQKKKEKTEKDNKTLEDKVEDVLKDINQNKESDKVISDIFENPSNYLNTKTIVVPKSTKEKLKKIEKITKKDNSVKNDTFPIKKDIKELVPIKEEITEKFDWLNLIVKLLFIIFTILFIIFLIFIFYVCTY